MEVGTEISQKIRSAIKAKLIELGAYVDDELPDYIMVMVANKKTREQMIADLTLFLGGNTNAFAEWLHGLLGKLQTISIDAKDGKEKKKIDTKKEKKTKKSSKGSDSSNNKPKTKSVSGSSSRKIKSTIPMESDNVKGVDAEKNLDLHDKPHDGKQDDNESQSAEVEDVRDMLVTGTGAPTDELAAELETTEARIEQSKNMQQKRAPNSSKDAYATASAQRKRNASPNPLGERQVQSSRAVKKHKGLTSVVTTVRKGSEAEEYDPLVPAVASVVTVTGRKSKVPLALQANSTSGDQISGMDTATEAQVSDAMIKLEDTASLQRIRAVLLEVIKQDREDSIVSFCHSVECSLRNMSPRNLAIAKIRIQRILFDYESSLSTGGEDMNQGAGVASSNSSLAKSTPLSSSHGNNDTVSDVNSTGDKTVHCISHAVSAGPIEKLPDNGLKDSSQNSKSHPGSPSTSSTATRPEESVSSSRNDYINPYHHHGQHQPKLPTTSSHSHSEIAPSSHISLTKPRLETLPVTNNNSNRHTDKSPMQNISLDSLHQKRQSELESFGKCSVLRIRPLLQNSQNAGGGSGDNSGTDSPKPISAEQLKVLAKNLKITVTNSRALRSCSRSNSEDSSSEESEETDSEEDSEEQEQCVSGKTKLSKGETTTSEKNKLAGGIISSEEAVTVTVRGESELAVSQESGTSTEPLS